MLGGRKAHARLMCGAAMLALVAAAGTANAAEGGYDIAPQPLSLALKEFGLKTGQPVLFGPSLAASKLSPGATDAPTAEAALTAMLAGTGLDYRKEGETFLIVRQGEGGGPQDDSAAGGGAEVEALIVTAQKKEEAIQDVPIAISAFTQKSLDAQKLEGGFDLLKAIPNVTFSKSNFSGYNFSIRGIGTKAVSATTDPAVAVSFNNTTLIVNRLFEQEYFDVERVEVLRGPQGTLYGRNATSGVINVISARPRLGEFEGEVKLEVGNYNAQRVKGMVNIPIGDTLAIRAAGALTKRDGYGFNEAAGTPEDLNGVSADVDGRDLWSARVTVGWEPIEQIRVNALWERFEEDDNRVRTSKQLCKHDPGPQSTGNWDRSMLNPINSVAIATLSQGCLPVSLYSDEAYGTPNGASLPYVSALFTGPSLGQVNIIGSAELIGLGYNPYYEPSGPGSSALTPRCEGESLSLLYYPINLCTPDPYGNATQSQDLRSIYSLLEPAYRAKADLFELSVDIDLTDSLNFISQTVYAKDSYYATQDFNRFTSFPIFNDSSLACGASFLTLFGSTFITREQCPDPEGYADGWYNVTPGGVFTDPQLGPSNSLVGQDLSQSESEQFNQEFRLSSSFDADFNFSLGANFTHFETLNDYYVFLNAATLVTHFFPFNVHLPQIAEGSVCDGPEFNEPPASECVYVDPNPLESINGEGHNYFRSANPYKLTSAALFGELYWQATETLKVTLGGRMTWDRKVFTPIPSQLLLMDYRFHVPDGAGPETCTDWSNCQLAGTGVNGRGSVAEPDIVQEWREPTGRMIVDWKPELGFTDETMLYASISHGYKGGGANPPTIAMPAGLVAAKASGGVAPRTFEPEFINAYEIGTKNTLMGGALILNGSLFHYDYEGYQVSKIVDRSAANENFDAKVWGAELEWIFSPTRSLRFNGTFGALRTEIADGEQSIDLMDRADGGHTPYGRFDEWMVLKSFITASSNCVAPVEIVDLVLTDPFAGPTFLLYLCPAGNIIGLTTGSTPTNYALPGGVQYNPTTDAPNGGAGFFKELGGNELPNAPRWTASLGAQYRVALPGGWDATLRGDFYWQDKSFARVYNTEYDRLEAWTNTNISLWVENPDWGVTAEVYVKNVFDETPITDTFLNSDDSGLTTNVFTLDPRLVGVSVRKSF